MKGSRKAILYEAENLISGMGTGIRTYGRNLVRAAGRLDYDVHGLIEVQRSLHRGGGRLNDVLAFDAVLKRKAPDMIQRLLESMSSVVGVRPIELPRSGLVISPHQEALQDFDRVFAVSRLMEIGYRNFNSHGRLTPLRLPDVPAAFHTTSVVPFAVKGCPNIYTVHDLVPLRLPDTTFDNKTFTYNLLMRLAKSADHIVTVSEYSRRDIIEHLGVDERRVTNTYQAVDVPARVADLPLDAVAKFVEATFGLELGNYYLFYGSIEPKKNVSRMIDAYARSRSKVPLVIASASGWQNAPDLRKMRDPRFIYWRVEDGRIKRDSQIRRLGYLPNDTLMTLVRGARAVLFPSIYEGFGLPVVEAMALGTPVITSNVSSLPEIAGDAAILVDPYSIDSIREAIVAVDSDTELRCELSRRGKTQARKFSPSSYDVRLKELYSQLGM
jgi:glycosyltransferase involved in cell wall biosynthesis